MLTVDGVVKVVVAWWVTLAVFWRATQRHDGKKINILAHLFAAAFFISLLVVLS